MGAAAAPVRPVPTRHWATLEPVRLSIAARAPLTVAAVTSPFDVSTLQPLAHPAPRRSLSADGPSGTIVGIAHPLPAGRAAEAERSEGTPPVHALTRDAASAHGVEARSLPERHIVPRRVLDGRPPSADLLHFPADAVQPPLLAGPTGADTPPVEATPAALMEEAALAESAVEPQATPEATHAAPRPTLGQARRLGLGPPFPGSLPEEVAQKAASEITEPAVAAGWHQDGADDPTATSVPDVDQPSADPVSAPEPEPPPVPRQTTARDGGPRTPSEEPAAAGSDTRAARLGLGPPLRETPQYRAAPDAASRELPPDPADVAVEGAAPGPEPPDTEPVPPDMRDQLREAFRVDVGERPVRRGPEATEEARQRGVRAFARDAEVFLPSEAGPLSSPRTRGLLGHELTHLAQQRVLGAALPSEDSSEGRSLEAAAQVTERHYRGDTGGPQPGPELLHVPRPRASAPLQADDYARRVADELVVQGIAHRDGTGALVLGPSPGTVTSAVQGQRTDAPPVSAWDRFSHSVGGGFARAYEESALAPFSLGEEERSDLEMRRRWEDYEWDQRVQGNRPLPYDAWRTQEERTAAGGGGAAGSTGMPSSTRATVPGGATMPAPLEDQGWELDEHTELQHALEIRLHQLNQRPGEPHLDELPFDEQQRVHDEVMERRRARAAGGRAMPTRPGRAGTGAGGRPGRPGAAGASLVPLFADGEKERPDRAPGFEERFGHSVGSSFLGAMTGSFLAPFALGAEEQEDLDLQRRWEDYNWRRREQGLDPVALERYREMEKTASQPGADAGTTAGAPTPVAGAAAPRRGGAALPIAAGVAGAAVHRDAAGDAGRRRSPHTGNEQLAPGDFDLEELVNRLYDRIRTRLRTELIVDRERAGLLADFR